MKDLQNLDGKNKAKRQSALTQLCAIYMANGITKTKDIAEATGFSERQIWRAKADIRDTDTDVTLTLASLTPASQNLTHMSVDPDTSVSDKTSRAHAYKEYPSGIVIPKGFAKAQPSRAELNHDELETRLVEACNGSLANPAAYPGLLNLSVPRMWLEHGCDLERDVLPTLREVGKRQHGKQIKTWDYFTRPVSEAKAKREAGLPTVDVQKPPGDGPSALARFKERHGVA